MTATVLITTSSFGTPEALPKDRLRQEGFHVQENPWRRTLTEAEVSALLRQHRPVGVIAGLEPLTAVVLREAASHLRVISRCGVGLDNVDVAVATQLGIAVYNTPEALTQAVAELTVGLILDLVRGITASDRQIRAGRWQKSTGFLLHELTVGIVGLGRIGKRVGALLRAFDAGVIGSDLAPDAVWALQHDVRLMGADELLRQADVVTLHVPGAADGRPPLIGARELGLMKQGSYLINTSRGGLVDEAALVAALTAGRLAGAAVDTFAREPYDGPLRQAARAVLTPHIGSYARAARIRMERDAVDNLLRGLRA